MNKKILEQIIGWLNKKATTDEDMYYVGLICGTINLLSNEKVYKPIKGAWSEHCSRCGKLVGENGYNENFCSHCGAKLKEQ